MDQDQGSVTERSHKLSVSSHKTSNEKSGFAPSEQSKIGEANNEQSKSRESDKSIPNFGGSGTKSHTVKMDMHTTKSLPGVKGRNTTFKKFDSILDVTEGIIEEDEGDRHNPFKAPYRHSKTSEDI